MLRVKAMSCCWPLATLHLLAEGPDPCVIHGQRTAFFVTFEVNDILILTPGEEGRPFSLPPKNNNNNNKSKEMQEIPFCDNIE